MICLCAGVFVGDGLLKIGCALGGYALVELGLMMRRVENRGWVVVTRDETIHLTPLINMYSQN